MYNLPDKMEVIGGRQYGIVRACAGRLKIEGHTTPVLGDAETDQGAAENCSFPVIAACKEILAQQCGCDGASVRLKV